MSTADPAFYWSIVTDGFERRFSMYPFAHNSIQCSRSYNIKRTSLLTKTLLYLIILLNIIKLDIFVIQNIFGLYKLPRNIIFYKYFFTITSRCRYPVVSIQIIFCFAGFFITHGKLKVNSFIHSTVFIQFRLGNITLAIRCKNS